MEACLYEVREGDTVRCDLCAHGCVIKEGRSGICGVRRNRSGVLETEVYGRLVARHVDPIEKKPLFHLLPGSRSYSIATVGCNFKCRFCQNADIAQYPHDRPGGLAGTLCGAGEVVADAVARQCRSIAYTYTEPTVFFEFALDCARLARDRGLKNVFVTNGYMSRGALEMAAPFLDGANVDLKAFSDDFYKRYCGARLDPVLETLKRMKASGVLVEVTTLLIPDLNDSAGELRRLAGFIVADLGPETPWHISRFHPTYRMTDRGPTPLASLQAAYEIGRQAGLRYVYVGNVPGEEGQNTFCHHCQAVLIRRSGFAILENHIEEGRCPGCGTEVYGIGMSPSGD